MLQKASFTSYARRCDADLHVIRSPLDLSFNRSLLSSKLLIPSTYRHYDQILFLDLDILINDLSPCIFDQYENIGFGAAIDERDSIGFKNTCELVWNRPELLEETHLSYFIDRGFEFNSLLVASINGGVLLFRPSIVADIFKDAYFSGLPAMSHEEAILAYVSQIHSVFFQISSAWNTQILHSLSAECGPAFFSTKSKRFKLIKLLNSKGLYSASSLPFFLPQAYRNFVSNSLEACNILHFAGGFPIPCFSKSY